MFGCHSSLAGGWPQTRSELRSSTGLSCLRPNFLQDLSCDPSFFQQELDWSECAFSKSVHCSLTDLTVLGWRCFCFSCCCCYCCCAVWVVSVWLFLLFSQTQLSSGFFCINQNPFAKPIIQQLGSSWTTPLENWKSSIFYMDFNKGAIHFSKLSV